MTNVRSRPAATLALLLSAAIAPAQPAPTSPPVVIPAAVSEPNLPRDIVVPLPVADPLVPSTLPEAGPAVRLVSPLKLDYTYLPGGGTNGFGNHDVELSAALNWVFSEAWAPLVLTPGFAVRSWQGPVSRPPGDPDLPGRVFDSYLDLGWRPRLREWLFADLGVTPGVHGDYTTSDEGLFRVRGRGLAIVALSEQFQFVGGILYVNRNRTKLLPAGGVLWSPNPDVKYQLVFPTPKVSRRLPGWLPGADLWGYVAGEFGGGTWAIERANGQADSVDYNDLRLILGAEATCASGVKGKLEIGYVFGRRVYYESPTPNFQPDDTLMLRAGVSY